MTEEEVLKMFVVYFSPLDYPGVFVLREWHVLSSGPPVPKEVVGTAVTLTEIRDKVPYGLVCIQRDPSHDPVIVETWL